MLRTRHLLPAFALAALAVPTAASAQDFCVNSAPGCQGLAIKANTLPTWLGTAAANGSDDRFFFGPGTIDVGALSYTSSEPLQLIGAGEGRTIIQSSVAGVPALSLGTTSDAEVSDMTLVGKNDAAGALRLFGAHASHVTAQSEDGNGYGPIMMFDGSRLDHVTAADQGMWAVGVISGRATIADSQLYSRVMPPILGAGNDVTVLRDRLSGAAGVGVTSGTMTVQDTLIDTRGSTAGAVAGVIVSPQNASAATVVVDRTTILGDGPADVEHFGLYGTASAGQHAQIIATNTVVSGFGIPVARNGTAGGPVDITTSHDAYGPAIGASETGDGTLSQDHIVTGAPRFADAASGDFTLRADSPLVDAGSDETFDAPATDLAGALRMTDGNGDCRAVVDIGAFERPALDAPQCHPASAPAPAPAAPAVVTGPVSGAPASLIGKGSLPGALRVSGLRVAPKRIHRGHRATVTFAVSRTATVAIKVINKKKHTVLTLKLKRSGTLSKHLRLQPGRYVVTATATDARGLRSKPAIARFTVVR